MLGVWIRPSQDHSQQDRATYIQPAQPKAFTGHNQEPLLGVDMDFSNLTFTDFMLIKAGVIVVGAFIYGFLYG